MLIIINFPCYAQNSVDNEHNLERPDVIEKLLNINTRDEALKELLVLNKYYTEYRGMDEDYDMGECSVNHVVVCPQTEGDPIYAVFKAGSTEVSFGGGYGKPLGHVILFDSDGNFIQYYKNANYIKGIFSDINDDGIIENVESIANAFFCKSHGLVMVLSILPIKKPFMPIFCVAYEESWDWKAVDLNNDNIIELQIFPKVKPDSVITFRWSKEMNQYTGYAGDYSQSVMVFNCNNKTEELEKFIENRKNKEKYAPYFTSLEEALKEPEKVLYELKLDSKNLNEISPQIGLLINLKKLSLQNNNLTKLPSEIGELRSLESLSLLNNQIETLPPEIGNLSNLRYLVLNQNKIMYLPKEIGKLSNLYQILIINNKLYELPQEIGKLKLLQSMDLSMNNINRLPQEIGNLENLKHLDLHSNLLDSLPGEIGNLTRLTSLSVSNNKLNSIPTEIGQLENLVILNVENNKLKNLPSTIGQLTNLETLNLAYNNLNALPEEIKNLQNLQRLKLSGNPLKKSEVEELRKNLPNTDIHFWIKNND